MMGAILNIILEAACFSLVSGYITFWIWGVGGSQGSPACTFCLFGFCCWLQINHQQDPPSPSAELPLSCCGGSPSRNSRSRGHDQPPPCTPDNTWQRAWDKPRVQATSKVILETTPDPQARARLLATATKESGAWLHALPITSLGLKMDDEVVRVAVGLCLGVPLCLPHLCSQCRASVDELATHDLSCHKSQCRHPQHAAIKVLIQ